MTRFPQAGLLDPLTGSSHSSSEYTIAGQVGTVAYREFQFDKSWELVPGGWTFEFWKADRLVGSQQFCIVDDAMEVSMIPRRLDSAPSYRPK